MNRSGRLFDLVHLLSGRRTRTIDEIAQRFDVSVRTAYRDLALLESQRIPVVLDDTGYRLMETATLRPLNLTAEEHALLKLALSNPSLRRRSALRATLESLEAKLDAAARKVEESPRALHLAGRDRSGESTDRFLADLERAAAGLETVEMRYRSLSGSPSDPRRLDPYIVFEREGAWYLIGHCHRHGEQRMFRLDRIQEMKPLGAHFTRPQDFSLDAYLDKSWSLITGRKRFDIELEFAASLAPLFLASQHHPGEKVAQRKNGTILYRVELDSLEEIARWLMGFGGTARVIAPDDLRALLESMASEIVAICRDDSRLEGT